MTTLTLRPGEEWRLLMGQRAVYAGEVAQIEGELMAGGVADVRSAQGRFLGRGLLSPASKILLRILTREPQDIDRAFFKDRLQQAWAYRLMLGEVDSLSLIHI